MAVYRNHIDSAYINSLGYDFDKTRESLGRIISEDSDNKYSYTRRRRSDVPNQSGARFEEYRNNVYLFDEPRRNGLTPRTAPVQLAEEEEQQQQEEPEIKTSSSSSLGKNKSHTKNDVGRGPAPLIFGCNLCGARFSIKSLLNAHQVGHDIDYVTRYSSKRPFSSSQTTNTFQCKYCDRKFELERTLHIHQMCHCKKITPAQRRKLGFTELLHEKKAPLPVFHKVASSTTDIGKKLKTTSPFAYHL